MINEYKHDNGANVRMNDEIAYVQKYTRIKPF